MVRSLLSLCLFLLTGLLMAQGVGINNPTPHASALLDLTSTDKGLLVPRMTTAQRDGIPLPATSLLVYNTTNARFEFFNGSAWVPLVVSGGTLDQAYDFGGPGAGRTITADAGAVTIGGTDGLLSTGTIGTGTLAPSGPGTRMLWYPRKAAFRAGTVTGTAWDDGNIGERSVAFQSATASGYSSFAVGGSSATGVDAIAMGSSATASGNYSLGIGYLANASGIWSYALGYGANASGAQSIALGSYNTSSGYGSATLGNLATASGSNSKSLSFTGTAASFGETVLGIGPTNYTPSTSGDTQFRTANATDRLLVVGNAIDANNNSTVDAAERSNALLILKNGNTAIGNITPTTKLDVDGQVRIRGGNPAAGRVLMGDATGLATWVDPTTTASGTLDQAYDFGGPGAGRTITADAGAVTIAGTDGLVSRGVLGLGATAPPGVMGNGVIMLWNPRKGAFRAGGPYFADPTTWNDEFIGQYSTAFGHGSRASGRRSMAWGTARADSLDATAWGHSTASGERSTAWGYLSQATGKESTAWGSETSASGEAATAWGRLSSASGQSSTAWGQGNATGMQSTAWGQGNAFQFLSTAWGLGVAEAGAATAWGNGIASGGSSTAWNAGRALGSYATAWGNGSLANSYAETAFGIGPTDYVVSPNGAGQFRAANATDRLLVVGNAIDLNNNDVVDAAERSNAFVILKNGNTAIGNITPTTRLDVDGQVRIRGGNPAAGRVLMGDATGLASWVDPSTTASGTLDQAYDFGGPGAGRTITADAGAVTIAGRDGLVVTGTIGSGAIMPSGSGTRMVWNPRKAAFRAGVTTGSWDDINCGERSMAWGAFTTASGESATAWGMETSATGVQSTAWGFQCNATGQLSTAWGQTSLASGDLATSWGGLAAGTRSTSWGESTLASGSVSTAFGAGARARSYGETATGVWPTDYTASSESTVVSTDRLFTIGNGQSDTQRSNAVLILKNGNTAIGNANPNTRLDVVAGTTGATTRVMTVRSNFSANNTGTGIALINSTSSTSNVGSEIISVTTNASTGLSDLRFHVHGGGGTNAGLDERMRIQGNGNVGIGTATPARRLHVATGASGATSNNNAAVVVEGGAAAYQHFMVPSTAESGLLFGTEVGSIRSGIIFNNTNVADGIIFRTGGNTNRMSITDAGLVGIGTTAPATRLQVNGGITVTPPAVVTANTTVFAYDAGDRSYVRLSSNSTPNLRIISLANGLSTGQMLVVECAATGGNGIRFQDTGNTNVSGIRDLLAEDTITFIWNGTTWLEIGFANN